MKDNKKPILIKIGKHYIDPENVAGIKNCKDNLYIILLKSEPEPQYPLWVKRSDVERAKEHFNILGDDL